VLHRLRAGGRAQGPGPPRAQPRRCYSTGRRAATTCATAPAQRRRCTAIGARQRGPGDAASAPCPQTRRRPASPRRPARLARAAARPPPPPARPAAGARAARRPLGVRPRGPARATGGAATAACRGATQPLPPTPPVHAGLGTRGVRRPTEQHGQPVALGSHRRRRARAPRLDARAPTGPHQVRPGRPAAHEVLERALQQVRVGAAQRRVARARLARSLRPGGASIAGHRAGHAALEAARIRGEPGRERYARRCETRVGLRLHAWAAGWRPARRRPRRAPRVPPGTGGRCLCARAPRTRTRSATRCEAHCSMAYRLRMPHSRSSPGTRAHSPLELSSSPSALAATHASAAGTRRGPATRGAALSRGGAPRGAAAAPATGRDLSRGRGRATLRCTARAARERGCGGGAHRACPAARSAAAAGPRGRPAAPAAAAPPPGRAGARGACRSAPGSRSARCAGSRCRCRGRRRGRLRARPRALAPIQRPGPNQRAACAARRARTAAPAQPLLHDADAQVARGRAAKGLQVRGARRLVAHRVEQQRRGGQVLRRGGPRSAARSARGVCAAGRARARASEAALRTLLRSEKTAASGAKGEERGGRAGAPASNASTAQRPQWYCARTAVGTADDGAAPPSASNASALLHCKTACAARRRLGGGLRGAGLPRGVAAPAAVWVRTRRAERRHCRLPGCPPPAPPTTWPRSRPGHTCRTPRTCGRAKW